MATLAGLGEFVGGLLLALGWLGPVGPAIIISVMVVAAVTVHLHNGFLAQNNGYEMPLLYAAGALAFAFAGFGGISLDAVAPIPVLDQPAVAWILIAIGVVGGLVVSATRRAPQAGHQRA